MKKRRSLKNLIGLYFSYHLNKTSLILFGVILVLWCLVLILNSGIPIAQNDYILAYKSYHFTYLEQSIFFLQILDGVIVAFLIGAELSTLSLFDPMIIPNTSRIKIVITKLGVNIFILTIILTFQILLLELIGVLIYPSYQVSLSSFIVILYLLIPLLEILFLGEFISLCLNSYFIPILIFTIHLVLTLLLRIEKISKVLCNFFPKILITINQIQFVGNIYISLGICFLLGISIALVFQKKDISS